MARRMLIDASHPEETRVAVVNGKRLDEFDYETIRKKQLKGNVYLAKIVRVEPSLQAAFVDYGGNRHGFLAFSEIHPDYYQIPVSDREQLLETDNDLEDAEDAEDEDQVETVGGDEVEGVERKRLKHYRRYKIQEVIKRRQIVLVQVVKEERGNKGAALTTYLSLAGRYCVLMPNTARGGGISRKINSLKDRKRLKKILDEFEIGKGMAVIVRTAGAERTKAEIKRDYEYLSRLWDDIRTTTMESIAPTLVHEEANLIKRSVRDLYNKDIDEILVEGEDGYRTAKDFMKSMVPSHAKRVVRYDDEEIPLFFRYQVESQVDAIHNPIVQLRSGGYLVINPTEALVAIDVNSGRATRERHIEETALKTNQEAAEEIPRQLRLRDLAGLIVIDFIDMEEKRNNAAVERRLKEGLRNERARIQIGRISAFGLMEMSRQRLRPSLIETSSESCPACGGTGHVRSTEATALHVMRGIEEEGLRKRAAEIAVFVPTAVALYVLNHKRSALANIEARYDLNISISADDSLIPPDFRIERIRAKEGAEDEKAPDAAVSTEDTPEGERRKRRPRRRRRGSHEEIADAEIAAEAEVSETDDAGEDAADEPGEPEKTAETGEPRKRRRRGKRGGRRRNKRAADGVDATAAGLDAEPGTEPGAEPAAGLGAEPAAGQSAELDAGQAEQPPAAPVEAAPGDAGKPEDGEAAPKKRRAPRSRKPATKPEAADAGVETAAEAGGEGMSEDKSGEDKGEDKKAAPTRGRRRTTAKKPPAAKRRTATAASKSKDAADTAESSASPAEPDSASAPIEVVAPPTASPEPLAATAPAADDGKSEIPDTPAPPKERRGGWWRRP